MSARSTTFWSFSETYCCLRREPSLASMLKRTAAELSVAEYSLTGIDTRPNERDSEAIERAAIPTPLSPRGPRAPAWRTRSIRARAVPCHPDRCESAAGWRGMFTPDAWRVPQPSVFMAALRDCFDFQ